MAVGGIDLQQIKFFIPRRFFLLGSCLHNQKRLSNYRYPFRLIAPEKNSCLRAEEGLVRWLVTGTYQALGLQDVEMFNLLFKL